MAKAKKDTRAEDVEGRAEERITTTNGGSVPDPKDGIWGSSDFDPWEGASFRTRVEVSRNGRYIRTYHLPLHETPVGEGVHLHQERWGINWHEVNHLLGQLLTHVDATFTDPVQRKCQKDLLRQLVGRWVEDVGQEAAIDAYGWENVARHAGAGVGGNIPSDPRGDRDTPVHVEG